MAFLKPKWIVEWTKMIKEDGIKSFIKQKGWKVVAAIFVFYLIRDSILYIIIPYFAITELGGC